jgi:preprotein translocase subunit SecG
MKLALSIIQVVSAVLVSILILLQPKGTGMGRAFGSTSYHSRRGMENIVFRMTIFLASLFVVASVVNQLII